VARDGLAVRDMTDSPDSLARVTHVVVTEDAAEHYELVLVSVWADELEAVFAELRQLIGKPALLLFGNNPGGRAALPSDLPGEVHLGFPGIGGSMTDGIVDFVRIRQQPTTLESTGGPVIDEFESALNEQGFETTRTSDMDGWLAYHGIFIGSIAAALDRCHGSATELAEDRDTLTLMCRSIEEGFRALIQQGAPGLPSNLRMLHRPILRLIAVHYWARTMGSPMGEQCFAAHARHAKPEMRLLMAEALQRVARTSRTEHLHELLNEN
jgi:ketopantoate reductase